MRDANSIFRRVFVNDAPIAYRRVGRSGAPSLVLLHGRGAHGNWWSGMIPLLTGYFDLIVPDLSGHGDSGKRESYGPRSWASEVAAILRTESPSKSAIIGHSMGGRVAAYLSAANPELVEQVVLIDTSFRETTRQAQSPGRAMLGPPRIYPTATEALKHFRLVPAQDIVNPELTLQVARSSIIEVDEGWTWKADPKIYAAMPDHAALEALRESKIPVSLIFGQFSAVCGWKAAGIIEATLDRSIQAVEIPGAYHHVIIDQPEACTTEVDRLVNFQRPS